MPLECNDDHVFHYDCMRDWAQHNYTCPICRKPVIQSDQDIKLYKHMHSMNQMNVHEDTLGSASISTAANNGSTQARRGIL